jgi:hypothetical protein
MSFTRRYVKLPIKLFNQEESLLTGVEETIDSYAMVNPMSIDVYRPSMENEGQAIHVDFRYGGSMIVYMHISDFEELLNKHQS